MPPIVTKRVGLPSIPDGAISLLHREIGQVPFADNQERKFDVKEQPNQIKHFCLHCIVDITVVTVGGLTPREDAPFNSIANIRFQSTQALTLKNVPGISLNFLNKLECGTDAHNTLPDLLVAGQIPVGAHQFEFDILIPFECKDNIFPERTILNTVQYNDLALYLQYADIGDSISGDWVDGVDILDNFQVDLVSLERPPVDKLEEILNRQQSIDRVQTKLVSSLDGFLLPENTMIKTLMVIVRRPGADRLRTNVGIGNLSVNFDSGNFVLRDMTGAQIQSENKQYYTVENIDVGVYVIEFDKSHDFSTLFNTKDRNYARLEWTEAVPPFINATIELFTRRIATPKQLTD